MTRPGGWLAKEAPERVGGAGGIGKMSLLYVLVAHRRVRLDLAALRGFRLSFFTI